MDIQIRLCRKLAIPFAALGIVGVILSFNLTALADSKVVWLSAAEVKKLKNPSIPEHFDRMPSHILIESPLFKLSRAGPKQISLGTPVATNANGVRLWILSPIESKLLEASLETNSGCDYICKPKQETRNDCEVIYTPVSGDKISEQFSVNYNIPKKSAINRKPYISCEDFAGTNFYFALHSTGIEMHIVPHLAAGSIELTVGITKPGLIGKRTVGFRVTMPNAATLVLDGGHLKDGHGNCYWAMITPIHLPVKPQEKMGSAIVPVAFNRRLAD